MALRNQTTVIKAMSEVEKKIEKGTASLEVQSKN